jgi:hypothetical protein
MEVTSAYLTTVAKFPKFMEAIQKAAVPPRVSQDFLQVLDFKSTNDRTYISVLKGLGFVDQNGVPTQVYRDYRNPAVAKKVLARQIKIAYSGLFTADEHAERLTGQPLKGKLATLTGKDAAVVEKMSSTFTTLCGMADFTNSESIADIKLEDEKAVVDSPAVVTSSPSPGSLTFSHTIYINLPATTEVAVYDAIFKSLRENLT